MPLDLLPAETICVSWLVMANKAAALRGRRRRAIMVMYWQGRLTAQEAAEQIGVEWRQISRQSPAGFSWDAARRKYVAKSVNARLRRIDED